MRNLAPITTDLFDQEGDRSYCWRLTVGVFITQMAGLILILGGLKVLSEKPPWQMEWAWYAFWLGVVAFIAWLVACWPDEAKDLWVDLTTQGEKAEPVPEAKRKTRMLRLTLVLIFLDACVLAVMIPITGGPGRSVLDPLLPTIPIMAMVLRQPKRTVFVALICEFIFVVGVLLDWRFHMFEALGFHASAGLHGVLPPVDPVRDWVYFTHRDPNHAISFGIVTGGAILLSMLELFRYNKAEIGRGIRAAIRPLTINSPLSGIVRSIRRGTRIWVRWLDHRDLPLVELSLVHTPEEVLQQAVILCAPYWVIGDRPIYGRDSRKRVARHITFLTFAAHWIDDHFDALNVYCRNDDRRAKILESSPTEILNEHYPRLDQILKRMKQMVRPEHQEEVVRAVTRIIYGGLIQNARTLKRRDELMQQYIAFVCRNVSPQIERTYKDIQTERSSLTLWVTAKVVMELLDACTDQFSRDQSEFINLLYGPILYYANKTNEVAARDIREGIWRTPEVRG